MASIYGHLMIYTGIHDILISSSVSNKGFVFFVSGKIYARCLYMCNIFVPSCRIINKIGIFEKQYCIYGSNIEYTCT